MSYRPNEDYDALLAAAGDLGTINELSLSGPAKKAWELAQHLHPFKHLTRLDIGGTRGAVRDAQTVDLLRQLPLKYLRFGPETVLSANRLHSLLTGPTKHPSLKELILDNVWAKCEDICGHDEWDDDYCDCSNGSDYSDWRGSRCRCCYCLCNDNQRYLEYMIFASDWLDYGHRLPPWTKSFSRQGCEKLIATAKTEGFALSGDAVRAPAIEDAIIKGKRAVEAFRNFKQGVDEAGPVKQGSGTFGTSDYMGAQQTWESLIRGKDDEEEESGYPFPLVLKRKNTAGSVSGTTSGSHTPGGTVPNGRGKSLSEHDLAQADQALSNHSAA